MPIIVNIQVTGESGGEIANDLRQVLNRLTGYQGEPLAAETATEAAISKAKPPSGRTREKIKAAAEVQAISTGEERVDPAAEAQDAKDEAADTAATKPVDLTHDDVKKMLGGYVQAYGMEAAQADGVGFIGAPKISEISNTQQALAKAIIGIAQGIEKNPNKRDIAGDGLTGEKTAELKVIVQAAMAVK
jgi:hypothetical protein